jgi:hypothetical protein
MEVPCGAESKWSEIKKMIVDSLYKPLHFAWKSEVKTAVCDFALNKEIWSELFNS